MVIYKFLTLNKISLNRCSVPVLSNGHFQSTYSYLPNSLPASCKQSFLPTPTVFLLILTLGIFILS